MLGKLRNDRALFAHGLPPYSDAASKAAGTNANPANCPFTDPCWDNMAVREYKHKWKVSDKPVIHCALAISLEIVIVHYRATLL